MHLRKGMLVRVIKGNHKGSEGKLLYVFPKKNKAIVEGVNMVKHSIRPTQENPSGGFSEKEAPIMFKKVRFLALVIKFLMMVQRLEYH